jgi:hypothetical protein
VHEDSAAAGLVTIIFIERFMYMVRQWYVFGLLGAIIVPLMGLVIHLARLERPFIVIVAYYTSVIWLLTVPILGVSMLLCARSKAEAAIGITTVMTFVSFILCLVYS